MGDGHQYDPYSQGQEGGGATRAGMRRRSGGEIVEVQGGHIVRSTGRKDRHSKVCTAKGPRDRRVRLSAHTAIEFYDVQDRLGYDRPSKAVDWLINKAKSAIDDLAELPPWKPTATSSSSLLKKTRTANPPHQQQQQQQQQQENGSSSFNSSPPVDSFTFHHNHHQQLNRSAAFLPPSLDSDAIADTIKSFFPMGSSENPPSLNLYPVPDLLSRTSSHTQDLRLSLHSHDHPVQHMFPAHFLGFDGPSSSDGGWPDHHHQQFQRSWSGDTPAGFIPQAPMLFGQNQQLVMSQRGPLQSSNSHSIRAWVDPAADQIHQPGMGFSSGFRVPARIQGDEEEQHDNKRSSTSSDSRH